MNIYNKVNHIISFRLRLIKTKTIQSLAFQKIKLRVLLPLGIYDKTFFKSTLESDWIKRIQDVIDCPDNKLIKRHPDAGALKNGKQVMHNGIKITAGGYYGEAIVQMLYKNKGVHEPQEEFAFEKVLHTIPRGGTMIELGSYWSFYSIWFHKEIKEAKNYMVEPEKFNLLYGINNFRLNNVSGKFTNALVGKDSGSINGTPIISIDDYVAENGIEFIDILHSDIQGFELDMLRGADVTIKNKKIGYFFISTHGNEIHYKCMNFLVSCDYEILCSADQFDTYSLDGLIVAKSPSYKGLEKIDISLKTKESYKKGISNYQDQ